MLRLRQLEQALASRPERRCCCAASPAAAAAAASPPPPILAPQRRLVATPLAVPPDDDYDPFHTGVAHFQHVHRPQLVTFVFSAGRHEPTGVNTYTTVDLSDESSSHPFAAAVPRAVDPAGRRGTYTWVSTATTEHGPEAGGAVTHFALFSGGNSHDPAGRVTMQSLLYSFEERADGSLDPAGARLLWVEPHSDRAPARFCLVADLGALYDGDGRQLSHPGNVDIVVTGYCGINIYSRPSAAAPGAGAAPSGLEDDWVISRRLSLPEPGAVAPSGAPYTGVAHLGAVVHTLPGQTEPSCLIVGTRSEWHAGRHGERPWQGNAPCLVYDFRCDSARSVVFHYRRVHVCAPCYTVMPTTTLCCSLAALTRSAARSARV